MFKVSQKAGQRKRPSVRGVTFVVHNYPEKVFTNRITLYIIIELELNFYRLFMHHL